MDIAYCYNACMCMYSIMEHGKENKKVVFFLTGWQNKLWMYWLFAKILQINGYYSISYAYNKNIFSPNTAQTTKCITSIADDVQKRIASLKRDGYQEISLFGISLGTLIALMVANASKDVSKVILNLTGADIAEAAWSWDTANVYFKRSLREQGYTLEKLRKSWKSISPIHNIDHLQHKKILVYLTKKDEIIPFILGEKLLNEFKRKHYDYKFVVNHHLDHLLTGTFNLCNAKVYLSFLKE